MRTARTRAHARSARIRSGDVAHPPKLKTWVPWGFEDGRPWRRRPDRSLARVAHGARLVRDRPRRADVRRAPHQDAAPPTWRIRSARATSCCERTPCCAPTSSRSRCPATPWLNQQWGAQLFLGATYRLGGWNAIGPHARSADVPGVRVPLPRVPSPGRLDADRRAPQRRRLLGGPAEPGHAAAADRASCSSRSRCGSWRDAARIPEPLWVIPALMLVWVNVHGSFVLVPVLLGLAWLEDRKDSPERLARSSPCAARRLAATLANPFGLRRLGVRRRDRHQPHDQPAGDRVGAADDPRVQRGRLLRRRR